MNQSFDANRVQRTHLSHLLNHTSSPLIEPFPASFVEPCAYWSHTEKASFFKSLARHSRWKPDLIVEDIGGGKTIADVYSYIALLEQGSARESRKRCKRDAFPTAHELSEEWIAVENAAAHELCGKETEWQNAALKHKRAQELKEVKKSIRRGSEIVRERGSEGDDVSTTSETTKRKHQASNEENEAWEERFKARKRELGDLWKREDMLSSLDGRYLKTMDNMVRTLESTEEDKAMEAGGQLDLENIDRDKLAQLRVPVASKFSHDVDAPLTDKPLDLTPIMNEGGSQIDPLLLAMDRIVTNKQPLPFRPDEHRDPVASESMGLQSAVPLPLQANTPEPSRIEDSGSVFKSLRTQPSVVDSVPQTPRPSAIHLADIPPGLSPASRRRLRKRLWTRRKRAMESGIPVSEVSMDMAKLKRGRKAKQKALGEAVETQEDVPDVQVEVNLPGALDALSHAPISQVQSEVPADAVDETEDGDKETDSVCKRKPYGWSKLMARQVSGKTLRADGVDLFNLENFVNIMSLLGRVHALSNAADSIDELEGSSEGLYTLSYPLLRLLRARVTHFVTCLMAYAILHKEVETRQKRRIRGIFQTGGADEIRAENIREALLHMETDTTTKHFFTRLKRTVRMAAAAHALPEEEIGPEPFDNNDSDETGLSDDESSTRETEDDPSLSTGFLPVRFNRMFQHVFPLPCDDPQSASPLLWNPSILSNFGGKEGDSLLPDETDEAVLLKELRAEEQIENADREAAYLYERELWMEIGVTRVEKRNRVTNVSSKQRNRLLQKPQGTEASTRYLNNEPGLSQSLRFKRPGGAVKSRVYIDSDEDL